MNWRAIRAIVRRDLAVLAGSKPVVIPIVVLPLVLFVGLPLLLGIVPQAVNLPGGTDTTALVGQLPDTVVASLPAEEDARRARRPDGAPRPRARAHRVELGLGAAPAGGARQGCQLRSSRQRLERHGDADPFAVTADLRAALDALGIPGPYVLVGYSLGGLYARAFAASSADGIAGLVLLDPSHEDQMTRLPEDMVAEMESGVRRLRLAVILDRVGLTRAVLALMRDSTSLPEQDAKALFAHEVNRRHLRAAIAEAAYLDDVPQRFRAEAADLGDLPVRLVSAGWPDDPSSEAVAEVIGELHRELAASLSTDVEHVSFLVTGHWSMVADPEHAERTVAEILTLVEGSTP